jgi:indolepyruvate ferredoxin oxidoreductase
VDNNLRALALGRLAAADPAGLAALRAQAQAADTPPAADLAPAASAEALLARGIADLAAYQNEAYAERYASVVRRVMAHEQALGADASLPLSCAVARSLHRLMAIKDEYEVARLYTDGRFQRQLRAQFDGDYRLEFYMAPPLLSRARDGRPPKKIRLGAWLLPALGWLARARVLRGTVFDIFGRSDERRLERALIGQYSARIDTLLAALTPERLALATQIAALPMQLRGFGHVKLAQLALLRAREAELLHRFDPARWPRPVAGASAGQIRGIAVTAAPPA